MWPRASCSSSFQKKRFPVEGRAGSNPNRSSAAATGACTSTTSTRRTRARTSTSWSAAAATSFRGTTTRMGSEQEHVLGADGQFHVEDEAVDVSIYGWEDWVTFALFCMMAAVVFYQVYTRYVLSDSAGWTEEIARYFLVAVVFIGASMSVRKNNHIQVDYFYRLMPRTMARVMSTAVDLVRCLFLGRSEERRVGKEDRSRWSPQD